MLYPSASQKIAQHFLVSETKTLTRLIDSFQTSSKDQENVAHIASRLIENIRLENKNTNLFQALLQQYNLSTKEGIILMCLSESLIRIPDAETANRLIEDKLGGAEWDRHIGASASLLVNASSWGLMLTGKVIRFSEESLEKPSRLIKRLVGKSSKSVIRNALRQAMKLIGQQFVMGRTIEEAIERSQKKDYLPYSYSFDMLGEAALTQAHAKKFFDSYLHAIKTLGQLPSATKPGMSISIKLSALHPRYQFVQRERVKSELTTKLKELVHVAYDNDISVTIDAEESERLELSLEIFEEIFKDPYLKNWDQLGLAIQAYQKRALNVIDWIVELTQKYKKGLPVRLVKGAYWDNEIKRAQQLGLTDYPLFSFKPGTDLSFLVCAQKLLENNDLIYPQFASHNAHTIASIMHFAKTKAAKPDNYEFQRLHGMGESLYDQLIDELPQPCRVYAPVGNHKELLPYLIRRLLENGANTSFVHQLTDSSTPIKHLIKEPMEHVKHFLTEEQYKIPLPTDIFGGQRKNSIGFNINAPKHYEALRKGIDSKISKTWTAASIVNGKLIKNKNAMQSVHSPINHDMVVGTSYAIDDKLLNEAIESANQAWLNWSETPVEKRAECLRVLGDLLEENRDELMALCIKEAGKTVQDAIDEIREAVDFCRYYADMAIEEFSGAKKLPGPTGESNVLTYEGRGVFVCISPWNFPLAIFMGQIVAALVAGNTVLAKPAEQTSLMATFAVQLCHKAGIPVEALQLCIGEGSVVGKALVEHPSIAGVVFTGSTEVAKLINLTLAQKDGPIVPLIAETGGQNCMVVDSSSLVEQVVVDVVDSAFKSAGQRCSALRVLFVQEDIADHLMNDLLGALKEVNVGDTQDFRTDIGPVIDNQAKAQLEDHVLAMQTIAKFCYRVDLPKECTKGSFVAPTIIEIESISDLKQENFGPILHVIRYKAGQLFEQIDAINSTGFGLTCGIHSRIETTYEHFQEKVRAGNIYINRNMIGAVVGVQPFGGQGLSGTGPKAGGPHYLHCFVTEKTITTNTAAIGGNVELLVALDKPK